MANIEETPSQAQKAEAVAEAGPGADANTHIASLGAESATFDNDKGNGTSTSPSNSSDIVAAPKKEEAQAPPRSKWKTVLIMASLMVRSSDLVSREIERF